MKALQSRVFTGSSQPTTELAFQAGLQNAKEESRQKAAEAKQMQATRKGKADEWLLEFERNRRLEALALRRAEMEAKNALRRHLYHWRSGKGQSGGGNALILALERAKLGLGLSEAQQKLIRAHQQYLEERAAAGDDEGATRDESSSGGSGFLTTIEAAKGLSELRAMLDPKAIEEARQRALDEAEREGAEQLDSYLHPLSMSQEEAPLLPPRTQQQGEADSDSGDAEAAWLMAAVTELLRERGIGITLADLSPLLASRCSNGSGRSWGEVWEGRHG